MPEKKRIEISIAEQCLELFDGERCLSRYSISTGRNGPGEQQDSFCTPRGRHAVAEKIGAGCAENTVFVGRQPTGEMYTPELRQDSPDRDWILTRILWLEGTEEGKNRGGDVDSRNRYIYIHGSPDDVTMGKSGSHGCIRMRNSDVIELFDQVEVGVPVLIRE
ncbi:MAG: L,D-transpeptidase [Gammaproteobacteria bacterium]|nr:L,D-transpeptidase [Gammaproteobacteria bacterium]